MVVRILYVLTSEFSRYGCENFIHILTQFCFQGMVVRISYMSLMQVNFQGTVVRIVYIHCHKCMFKVWFRKFHTSLTQGTVVRISDISLTQVNFQSVVVKLSYIALTSTSPDVWSRLASFFCGVLNTGHLRFEPGLSGTDLVDIWPKMKAAVTYLWTGMCTGFSLVHIFTRGSSFTQEV